MIKGIKILLAVSNGETINDFGETLKSCYYVPVDNVLVGQPDSTDIVSSTELTGIKTEYVLGIPKGDRHEWKNTTVILPEPFAGTYQTIGDPVAGIEENIPLSWNKKVRIQRIE